MKYARKFIIKIIDNIYYTNTTIYVNNIMKNSMGYFCIITKNKEKAKIFKYKKNCEKNIYKLQNFKDPTKKRLNNYKYEIIEITDNQILRKIKIKKLSK